jgi:N utilization substance protein B
MISRRKTREYLLQVLYARTLLKESFDRDIFFASYFADDQHIELDTAYVTAMEDAIMTHQDRLIGYIEVLAPKFEVETLPTLHILILMISLTEILYFSLEKIPDSVSVNEAIELAKRFSDDQGKSFINGTLSTFLKEREILKIEKQSEFRLF